MTGAKGPRRFCVAVGLYRVAPTSFKKKTFLVCLIFLFLNPAAIRKGLQSLQGRN